MRNRHPAPGRPGRMHGLATAGMALCALVGIGAMLLFVTVRWPADTSRYPIAVFVVSVVGFLTCAATAVLAAARDTYPRVSMRQEPADDAKEQ